MLFGHQIAGLPLSQLDLVILSACYTGEGDVVDGEGIFSLLAAFHLAGTSSAVFTLWDVYDEDAPWKLLGEYHRNLSERKLGKLAALVAVQRKILDSRGTQPEVIPRGWAAWQYSGHPGDLSDFSSLPPAPEVPPAPPSLPTPFSLMWILFGGGVLVLGVGCGYLIQKFTRKEAKS